MEKIEIDRSVITFIKTKLHQLLTPYMKKWKIYQLEQTLNFLIKEISCTTLSICFVSNIRELIIEKLLCSPREYLREMANYHFEGYLFVYLSIWFPMIQPQSFDLTTQKNGPSLYHFKKVKVLLYSMLEAPRTLCQICYCFVETAFWILCWLSWRHEWKLFWRMVWEYFVKKSTTR